MLSASRSRLSLLIASLACALILAGWMSGVSVASVVSSTPFVSSSESVFTGAFDHEVFVIDGENLKHIDHGWDETSNSVPVAPSFDYPGPRFVTADINGDHVFVSSLVYDEDSESSVDMLTVYGVVDGELEFEQETPVPDIIRYQLATPSPGMKYLSDHGHLLVYNYNDRTREDPRQDPVEYWLSIFDVASGEWLEQRIEMNGCGTLMFNDVIEETLYIACHDRNGEIRQIDLETLEESDRFSRQSVDASVVAGRTHWLASSTVTSEEVIMMFENGEIHRMNIETGDTSVLDALTEFDSSAERIVPRLASSHLNTDSGELYVAVSSSRDEHSRGLSSAIAVVDLESEEITRTIEMPGQFQSYTPSPNGEHVYALLLDSPPNQSSSLVAVDLDDGASETVATGDFRVQHIGVADGR